MWEYNNELYHFGTKGQKWGVRRYQNPDGSLTEAGKQRYASQEKRMTKLQREINDHSKMVKISELAAEKAHKNANKYRQESAVTKPRNIVMKAMRKLTQHDLDRNAKEWDQRVEFARNNVKRTMHKIGKLEYAQMDVYLADVWGLPFDMYNVHRKEQ